MARKYEVKPGSRLRHNGTIYEAGCLLPFADDEFAALHPETIAVVEEKVAARPKPKKARRSPAKKSEAARRAAEKKAAE